MNYYYDEDEAGCFDDYDYDNYPPYEEKPIYEDGQLAAMTEAALFDEMDRAYGAQASCVDNGGSDDQSYRSERRCDLVEAELKRRGLADSYWDRDTAEVA